MFIFEEIESILSEIAQLKSQAGGVKEAWDRAISELEKQYGSKLNEYKAKIKQKEKELLKLSRANRSIIFDGTDKREFATGVLYLQMSEKVRRARGVTPEKLKQLGYLDGIKVIEKVNWDTIEKWPDEKLIAIGTERVRKEEIKYETR
ncbi:MAG: host-nuclease inhibitor Gam family protein [Candidatus Desulfofervidus auxilii]|nr:host-nuclease inhibitor Gam family protein [Candidatus Desulfofervidus auxilii]